MTKQEWKQRLSQAVTRTAPDDVDAVLSRCETRKGTVIQMTTHKNGKWVRNLIAACLALIVMGAGGGVYYRQVNAVASVVSLDVNPSIELKVNRGEKVIVCSPLNADAELVLADMGGGADLKGAKLDVAVNAIVGALLKNGYLDSISSAILISVEDKDADRAARLRQELTAAVDGVLQANASNASVLSQALTLDADLDQQARTNNISSGKAALVNQALQLNSKLDFEELAGLSVEELKDLIKIGAPAMPVGKTQAACAAEEYAGTLAMDSVTCEVDSELDDQMPHYEVELKHPALGEFEYMVDAWTGKVFSGRANIFGGDTVQTADIDIGIEKAKLAALNHAGVKESQAADMTVERDYEDGRLEYEVEFWVGSTEYDYTIDAATGTVLSYDVERYETSRAVSGSDIGESGAKTAALNHAGVKESQVTGMKVEQDYEADRLEYEVEFWVGSTEYDYTIDAATGTVLSYDVERHEISSAVSGSDIGESGAKTAALNHAGVEESQVFAMKVERDYKDGCLEYEVEFKYDGIEYEYTIDGFTGAVLEHEMDWDD